MSERPSRQKLIDLLERDIARYEATDLADLECPTDTVEKHILKLQGLRNEAVFCLTRAMLDHRRGVYTRSDDPARRIHRHVDTLKKLLEMAYDIDQNQPATGEDGH